MTRLAALYAALLVAGAALGFLAQQTGLGAGAAIALTGGLTFALLLLVVGPFQKRRFERMYVPALRAQLDPGAAPPAAAVPAPRDRAEAWNSAMLAKDFKALRGMVTPDFTVTAAKDAKHHPFRVYVRTCRLLLSLYPDLRCSVEEVRAEEGVEWVLLTELGHGKRGSVLDCSWWERHALEGGKVRELSLLAVTRIEGIPAES